VIACYGQTLYDSAAAAVAAAGADAEEFVFSEVVAAEYVLLGAVATNDDGSEQIAIPAQIGVAGSKISGPGGGMQGVSFVATDGSVPMTGDLSLGGNALTSASVDGATVDVLLRAYTATGDVETTAGALAVNTEDCKVLVGGQTVADRILPYDPARIYKADDIVIHDRTFYKCTAATVGPEVFDPASWEQTGANPLDPASGVILTNPPDADRNTFDLTSQSGGGTAFTVDVTDSQLEDIASFGPRLGIGPLGVPYGTFQGGIEMVTQVGHGLSGVGRPLYQRPDNVFALADISNPDTYPTCVLREVVDANRFLVQYTGIVPNLDAGVFDGGAAQFADLSSPVTAGSNLSHELSPANLRRASFHPDAVGR
jgi:hypothetical protein